MHQARTCQLAHSEMQPAAPKAVSVWLIGDAAISMSTFALAARQVCHGKLAASMSPLQCNSSLGSVVVSVAYLSIEPWAPPVEQDCVCGLGACQLRIHENRPSVSRKAVQASYSRAQLQSKPRARPFRPSNGMW